MLITIPKKYLPKHLSKKDKKIIRKELKKSRKQYKRRNIIQENALNRSNQDIFTYIEC